MGTMSTWQNSPITSTFITSYVMMTAMIYVVTSTWTAGRYISHMYTRDHNVIQYQEEPHIIWFILESVTKSGNKKISWKKNQTTEIQRVCGAGSCPQLSMYVMKEVFILDLCSCSGGQVRYGSVDVRFWYRRRRKKTDIFRVSVLFIWPLKQRCNPFPPGCLF